MMNRLISMDKDVPGKYLAKDKQLGNIKVFTTNSVSTPSKEPCNTIALKSNKKRRMTYTYLLMTGLHLNRDREAMNGLKTVRLSMRSVGLEMKLNI